MLFVARGGRLPKQVIGFVSAVCHLDEGGSADGKGGLPHLHLDILMITDIINSLMIKPNWNERTEKRLMK